MKGSDKVEMTINIGGELIKLNVPFDDQINIRDAERLIKNHYDDLKKSWPDSSDKIILALVTFKLARWCQQLLKIHEEALGLVNLKKNQLEQALNDENSAEEDLDA